LGAFIAKINQGKARFKPNQAAKYPPKNANVSVVPYTKNRKASKASSYPCVTVENGEKHKAQGERFVANLGKPSKSLEHKKHAHKASVSFPADPNTQW